VQLGFQLQWWRVGWRGINGGFYGSMVLKKLKALSLMFFFGMSTTEFQEGAGHAMRSYFCNKGAMENEPY
jgi:uncharacterized membrane protein